MDKKKRTTDNDLAYDNNIIETLLRLKTPIVGFDGKEFSVRKEARNESGVEHIARKSHRLKVRDIESIPSILKHPQFVCDDPDNHIYKNYYGIRRGKDQNSFIKIVTSPVKYNRTKEEIVTVYPTNSIKVEKTKKRS